MDNPMSISASSNLANTFRTLAPDDLKLIHGGMLRTALRIFFHTENQRGIDPDPMEVLRKQEAQARALTSDQQAQAQFQHFMKANPDLAQPPGISAARLAQDQARNHERLAAQLSHAVPPGQPQVRPGRF